jgi:hypothetical protein
MVEEIYIRHYGHLVQQNRERYHAPFTRPKTVFAVECSSVRVRRAERHEAGGGGRLHLFWSLIMIPRLASWIEVSGLPFFGLGCVSRYTREHHKLSGVYKNERRDTQRAAG